MYEDFYKPAHSLDANTEHNGVEIGRIVETVVQGDLLSGSGQYDVEVHTDGNNLGSSSDTTVDSVVETASKSKQKAAKLVNKMDILNAVFSTLMGKDRTAKIFKYVIDILRIFVQRSTYYRHKSLDLNVYSQMFADRKVMTVLRNPKIFLQLMASSSVKLFLQKGALVSDQLGFYRQIMRCGGTPFRLHSWYHKILKTVKETNLSASLFFKLSVIHKNWWNEDTLSEFIDLYYGISDELMLLYKLKLWSNKTMYERVSRHEVLSWYYDILLGLKKNWEKLQHIRQQEFELKIQYQVRQRALELSSKITATDSVHSEVNSSLIKQTLLESFKQDNLNMELEMIQRVKQFQYDKRIVKLDLARLSFDFLADSTDVFSIRTPPGTYAILSLCSGVLGFSKLWSQAKQDLIEH